MKPDGKDDLVSMTAIVAGAVVSVVVTVMSMIMSDEEPRLRLEVTVEPAPEAEIVENDVFLDPRGPERGPTDYEWRAIGAYEPIEAMSAAEPSIEAVDEALRRLEGYAISSPENPYVQELHLKGLRVAQYWAVAGGDTERAARLAARFEAFRTVSEPTRWTALEGIRFDIQRLEQNCHAAVPRVDAMTSAALPFMEDAEVSSTLEYGLALALERCGVGSAV
jgi:hypothetical protein